MLRDKLQTYEHKITRWIHILNHFFLYKSIIQPIFWLKLKSIIAFWIWAHRRLLHVRRLLACRTKRNIHILNANHTREHMQWTARWAKHCKRRQAACWRKILWFCFSTRNPKSTCFHRNQRLRGSSLI